MLPLRNKSILLGLNINIEQSWNISSFPKFGSLHILTKNKNETAFLNIVFQVGV